MRRKKLHRIAVPEFRVVGKNARGGRPTARKCLPIGAGGRQISLQVSDFRGLGNLRLEISEASEKNVFGARSGASPFCTRPGRSQKVVFFRGLGSLQTQISAASEICVAKIFSEASEVSKRRFPRPRKSALQRNFRAVGLPPRTFFSDNSTFWDRYPMQLFAAHCGIPTAPRGVSTVETGASEDSLFRSFWRSGAQTDLF